MSIFFAILLTVVAFGCVVYPLLCRSRHAGTGGIAGAAGDEPVDELLRRRDTTYSMIKEIEFDYLSGLLSEDDYRDFTARYRGEAISILKSIDQVGMIGDDADAKIESQVAAMRQEKQRFCPQCGVAWRPANRFCANCGASLPPRVDD